MPWGPWVDLQYTDEDQAEEAMTSPASIAYGRTPKRQYPYGTKLSFTKRELEKMGCEARDFKLGEILDLRAMGTVTAVRDEENSACVEVQIERITCEDEGAEEPPEPPGKEEDDDD